MSSSQLLMMKQFLNEDEYNKTIEYLQSLSRSSTINTISFSIKTGLSSTLINKIIKFLEENKIICSFFAIKCPECGMFIKKIEEITEIEKSVQCYNCEEDVEISTEDVFVLYSFIDYPFRYRQQIQSDIDDSVAVMESTGLSVLEYIANNDIDLNRVFFNPTNDDYAILQDMYDSIFVNHKNTKSKGDSLEDLVCKLFSLCKHFSASKGVRPRPNQIDCYVRNKLFVPGLSNEECRDGFLIECKNENKTPSGDYFHKINSIMGNKGYNFGIIVSKCHKPKTYNSLANQIFLKDKKIIISLDSSDLRSIIFDKENLLELMERYITETKLDATKDLRELGLYEA